MMWGKIALGVLYCLTLSLRADELSDSFNDAVNGIKNSVVNMGIGMAASFSGKCLQSNCHYTFVVWNDSPGPIYASRQDVKKIMGADFDSDEIEGYAVGPYKHFGGEPGVPFYHAELYFKIALQIDKNNEHMYEHYSATQPPSHGKPSWKTLYRKNIATPDPDSKHVYTYRVYSQKGVVKAEYLGIKTTSDQFSGVFFNNSTLNGIQLKFTKNTKEYQVTLEPGSFNLLNSDAEVAHSIRPPTDKEQRYFTFLYNNNAFVQLPIAPEGICNMMEDPKKKGSFIAGDPMVYTYEVYQGSSGPLVGLQGLAIGHYTQMVDPKQPNKQVVRDINPVECHMWCQSADQAKQQIKDPKDTTVFLDFPGQIWMCYQSKDWNIQQKITPGTVTDFALVRPQLSESQVYLYVVALNTTDDTKAKQWLARFTQGVIGKNAHAIVAPIQKFDAATTLDTIMPNSYGIISDTQKDGSGIDGFVLVADGFTPRGVGIGPFYYTIPPMISKVDQLLDIFSSFFDAKKIGTQTARTTFNQQLSQKILTWIKTYPTDKQSVTNQVTSLLQQYGYDRLFEKGTQQFNNLGQRARDMIISGPVSIQHYPHIVQTGSNEYVLSAGEKPTAWPAAKT